MLGVLWRLTRGYRLTPWKDPYLRWRMETYWGMHADQITFREFWKFLWRQRRELVRYLKWADRMQRAQVPDKTVDRPVDRDALSH